MMHYPRAGFSCFSRSVPVLALSALKSSIALPSKGIWLSTPEQGSDLSGPIEITDPKTLADFVVWTGTGTGCTGACSTPSPESFIVDWSQPVADHPNGLHRYEVSFYAKLPDEKLIYVVFYEYDPATEHGYVYFPGRTEEWYRLDVSTILHGVEGKWFRAWSVWEGVARPLIAGARTEGHVK